MERINLRTMKKYRKEKMSSLPSPPLVSVSFIGGALVDHCGWLKSKAIMERSNPGRFEEYVGGASLNVASVYTQLGGKAELFSILSEDSDAQFICSAIKDRKISHQHQTSKIHKTASYTSIMQPGGELVIALADTEIYNDFEVSFCLPRIKSMNNTDWVCVDTNLPVKEIELLVKSTPGSVAALTVSAAKAQRLLGVAKYLDLLFTNRAEALAMLDIPNDASSETLVHGLSSLGIKRSVLSDGSNRVWLVDNGEVSSLPVLPMQNIVDATGAGDTLAGTCLFALGNGAALPQAVELGITAAQKVLQVPGPFHKDLAKLLEGELH